jgi:hypothetical protein
MKINFIRITIITLLIAILIDLFIWSTVLPKGGIPHPIYAGFQYHGWVIVLFVVIIYWLIEALIYLGMRHIEKRMNSKKN